MSMPTPPAHRQRQHTAKKQEITDWRNNLRCTSIERIKAA